MKYSLEDAQDKPQTQSTDDIKRKSKGIMTDSNHEQTKEKQSNWLPFPKQGNHNATRDHFTT